MGPLSGYSVLDCIMNKLKVQIEKCTFMDRLKRRVQYDCPVCDGGKVCVGVTGTKLTIQCKSCKRQLEFSTHCRINVFHLTLVECTDMDSMEVMCVLLLDILRKEEVVGWIVVHSKGVLKFDDDSCVRKQVLFML